MTPAGLPSWPAAPVAYGPVVLRQFSDRDVPMAQELSTDPYVPLVGSLPANASREQARDWVDRQRQAGSRVSRTGGGTPRPFGILGPYHPLNARR